MTSEYKMKLFTGLRQNLKNMLNYDDIVIQQDRHSYFNQEQKQYFSDKNEGIILIKQESFSNKLLNSSFKHWLFFFKAKTRTFFFSDVSVKSNYLYFDKITINTPGQENINYGNCSVLGEDGQIYLMGGVSSKINSHSEDYYKNIYQLDFNSRNLMEVGQMISC